jgi:hypothetical protein
MSWGVTGLEQKSRKNNDRVANRTQLFKSDVFKLGLVDSRRWDKCKQASVIASHVLCDFEALALLKFKHLGHHFLKPGDFVKIFVSKILHFVQSVGLLNA